MTKMIRRRRVSREQGSRDPARAGPPSAPGGRRAAGATVAGRGSHAQARAPLGSGLRYFCFLILTLARLREEGTAAACGGRTATVSSVLGSVAGGVLKGDVACQARRRGDFPPWDAGSPPGPARGPRLRQARPEGAAEAAAVREPGCAERGASSRILTHPHAARP